MNKVTSFQEDRLQTIVKSLSLFNKKKIIFARQMGVPIQEMSFAFQIVPEVVYFS